MASARFKSLLVCVCLFFSGACFAETTENRGASRSSEPQTSSGTCFFCSLPVPHNKIHLNQICGTDPFKVICENNKTGLQQKAKTNKEIIQAIEAGENKVLKSLGYKNLSDAVAKKLGESGIAIDPKKNLKFKQVLKQDAYWDISQVLKPRPNCQDAGNTFPGHTQVPANEKLNYKRDLEKKLSATREKLSTESEHLTNLRADNLEGYYTELYNLCQSGKSVDYTVISTSSAYRRFRGTCENWNKVEAEFESLSRRPDSLKQRQDIKSFVKKYSYFDRIFDNGNYIGSTSGTDNEIRILEHNLKNETELLRTRCNIMINTENTVAQKKIADLLVKVHTNKIFVDHMFDSLFKPNEVNSFRNTANAARQTVAASVNSMFPLSHGKVAVMNSIKGIQTQLPERADASLYKTTSEGQFLDDKKLNGSRQQMGLVSLFDPSLPDLKDPNAFYVPQLGNYSESISPVGAVFQKNADNPYSVFTILAHEFGHHCDANNADLNGLPLQKDYEKILSCYRKPRSLKMTESQRAEVSADYVSASAIAHQLIQVPENNRANMFIESMKVFCDYAADGSPLYFSHGSHPHPRMRVNAIFAAHPEVRKALGCDRQKGYSYEVCP